MKYYRIMSLDIGKSRIGIALSDLMRTIATPFQSYKTRGTAIDLAYLQSVIKEQEVQKIVCGLPISLNQTENEQAKYCRNFAEKLQNICNLPIVFVDEKLTTVEAEEMLKTKNIPQRNRKEVIDSFAAAIILNDFLKSKENIMDENKSKQDELFDELEGDIVEFETEDGRVVEFEHICTIEHKGTDYYLFSPVEASEGIEEDEVAIFTIVKEGDEMIYQMVEDEALLDEVYAEYVAIMSEEFDGDDDSGDDGDGEPECGPQGCSVKKGCGGCCGKK